MKKSCKYGKYGLLELLLKQSVFGVFASYLTSKSLHKTMSGQTDGNGVDNMSSLKVSAI